MRDSNAGVQFFADFEPLAYFSKDADTISIMLSDIILKAIIFLLPTQLGLHFWPDFSRVVGIKIDYLSPTLYLTDLFLIIYLLLNLRPLTSWLKQKKRPTLFLVGFAVINTVFGVSPISTLYWWSRNILYLIFFITLRLNKVTWKQIKRPLLFSTLLVVILEVFQAIGQHSVNGLFYWLGERNYLASTPGLGKLSIMGRDFIRPQSTFSHPNSLAGYLLIVNYLFETHKSPIWQRLVVFTGLIFTFSKAALLAYLLVISLHLESVSIIVFLIASILQIFLINLPDLPQFVSDRLILLAPTKKIIMSHPLTGTGLGGFIPSLAKYLPGSFLVPAKLQPVHNIILLLIAETGAFGLGSLIYIVKANYRKIVNKRFLALLALVIITGCFDHYWWTLPQNKLIILLATALML